MNSDKKHPQQGDENFMAEIVEKINEHGYILNRHENKLNEHEESIRVFEKTIEKHMSEDKVKLETIKDAIVGINATLSALKEVTFQEKMERKEDYHALDKKITKVDHDSKMDNLKQDINSKTIKEKASDWIKDPISKGIVAIVIGLVTYFLYKNGVPIENIKLLP